SPGPPPPSRRRSTRPAGPIDRVRVAGDGDELQHTQDKVGELRRFEQSRSRIAQTSTIPRPISHDAIALAVSGVSRQGHRCAPVPGRANSEAPTANMMTAWTPRPTRYPVGTGIIRGGSAPAARDW